MTIAMQQPVSSPEKLDSIARHLFSPMGAPGVYGRTGLYEGIVRALEHYITRQRQPGTQVYHFPPVMTRAMIEKSDYLSSFPNLLGCVCCIGGSERDIKAAVSRFTCGTGDWTDSLSSADLVLTPASCYPIYPIAAALGPLPADGLLYDVAADCFRREPSDDLDRLQSFRMREYVRIAKPDQIQAFRKEWMERATGMADAIGLPYRVDVASDPFFGRGGELMAASQVEQSLKFELLVPVISQEKPTACMSFNYHREHFGEVWDIRDDAGNHAHTGCVAFGMDRLAVALFCTHGLDLKKWPQSVRATLALD